MGRYIYKHRYIYTYIRTGIAWLFVPIVRVDVTLFTLALDRGIVGKLALVPWRRRSVDTIREM